MDFNLDLDLTGFGKVGVRLIEKISDATGVVYEPTRITRRAKAEAKAAVVRAKGEDEVTAIRERTAQRFVDEQVRYQENMETIIEKASSRITEEASPEDMSNDWLLNFFDKSRMVSEDEMQELWARVLEGEANNPGFYSRKTVNILADIEAEDARLFKQLSDFRLIPLDGEASITNEGQIVENFHPSSAAPSLVILDDAHSMYTEKGINFNLLARMEWLGLIRHHAIGYAFFRGSGEFSVFEHSGGYLYLAGKNRISLGRAEFTVAGRQLSKLCVPFENPSGFTDYATEIWRSKGVRVYHDLSEAIAAQTSSTV